MSVWKAAITFGGPDTTLQDHVLGKVDAETAMMDKLPLFTQYEEARLVNHFKTMASYGYAYTRQKCVDIASDLSIQLGKRTEEKPLSIKWI